ncbi:MFS transporter [Aquincola tertiaricarbonis]|uniref:MFS transporter n=1 Tax=Aquincola tertiaricarbonis TaxID=391953 RepID=UPI000614BC2B|nr:MFS transporter [Aquincola tertiaricarbonis]
MNVLAFLRENARWLALGFLLLFFGAVGQTYFLAMSVGDLRRELGLSHSAFSGLYMAATLISAFTLPHLGGLLDRHAPHRVVACVVPMLALAAAALALSTHWAAVFLALIGLRLFGQGLMPQTAFNVLGRWFAAERGRAVSIATLGFNGGQALLPAAFVALAAVVGWRSAWAAVVALLLLAVWPLATWLAARERQPRAADVAAARRAAPDRTRAEALRTPLFWLALLGVVPPAFIAGLVFFHQTHLAEVRGWSLQAMAASLSLLAVVTVTSSLITGPRIDRGTAAQWLPVYLLPLGAGCLVLGLVPAAWAVPVFMVLFGITDGIALTLMGALWPELFGVRHVGAIRAVVVSVLVTASAAGPGLGGVLIDAGVPFPAVVASLSGLCFGISALMPLAVRHARAHRARAVPPVSPLPSP